MEPRSFQLFPDSASNFAPSVDGLYTYMVVISAFFSLLVAFLIVFFAIKYRKRPGQGVPAPINDHSIGSMILEIAWSVIPLGLSLVMFAWGASIMFTESRPPKDSLNIYVTGKRWMWKIQHLEGAREINELHVPVNRDIRLTMTSEDVIHDFYVPAFRTKADVLPGRYTTEWFRPTKVGDYHIFCAEYCGTKHSGMIGWVHVMTAEDYDKWLAQGSGEGSMAEEGESLFRQLGCANCHVKDGHGRAPNLYGAFGMKVDLADGSSVRFDEAYTRESILYPQAKIVAGYDRIMPTFHGLISDEGMLKLIEYIKSLGDPNGTIQEKDLQSEPSNIQKTGTMMPDQSEMPKAPAAKTPAAPRAAASTTPTGTQQ
jgi:cytochrome c oxidase subunit 2